VWNGLIAEPINTLASSLAGMLAQVSMGVLMNGIWIGKRDLADKRDFLDTFIDSFVEAIKPGANSVINAAALALTQWLANFSQLGKRDLFDNMADAIFNALHPVVNQTINAAALALTQWLANFAAGKRDLFDNMADAIFNALHPVVNQTINAAALALTQWLANFASGKRDVELAEMRGWFGDIVSQIGSGLKPHANDLINAAALLLTQTLANFSNGRRGISDFFSDLADKVQNVVNNAAMAIAKPITIALAAIANNGLIPTIGKRDAAEYANFIIDYINGLLSKPIIPTLPQIPIIMS